MTSNLSTTETNISVEPMTTYNITNYTYCNLVDFEVSYRQIHGYLSIFVCIFGSITNVVNIIVLTTRAMRWPTNFILTGLAIADVMVMLAYIPFASHNYLHPEKRFLASYFSYRWALYMYFQALFTQICHFISCCLTVMLAIWRYLAITEPQNSKIWCSHYRTKISILLTYALCPIVCLPLIFGLYTDTKDRSIYPNGTLVPDKMNQTYNNTQNLTATLYVLAIDEEYMTFNFWVYSVVIKFVPSVLLTVLSTMLIWALLEAKRRWERLNNNSAANNGAAKMAAATTTGDTSIALLAVKTTNKVQRNAEKEQQATRTNRMLLAVLLLFLMTEFPQAIMGLLGVILGKQFQNECYFKLGDVFDMVALLNSAINFILYCSMSSQFRATFKAILLHPVRSKWKSMDTQITEIHENSAVKVTQL